VADGPVVQHGFGRRSDLLLRLAGIKWKIALPMFRPKNPEPE